MKVLYIKTNGNITIENITKPLYKDINNLIGGHMEIVKPQGLPRNLCMIIDDEGRLKSKPINIIGSILFETAKHGQPIVGDIVITGEKYEDGECDITGLADVEISILIAMFKVIF